MVSVFQYITVAQLEAYSGIDYSVLDATFTNTIIDTQISIAEYLVNDIKRQSYTSAPGDVVAATYLLSKILMNNMMIEFGYGAEGEVIEDVASNEEVRKMLSGLASKKYDYKLVNDVTSGFFN